MNRSVFVDTSAWYALADSGDAHHTETEHLIRHLLREQRTTATTNHVVAETYTLIRVRLGFAAAQAFLRRTASSPSIQRVFVPESWESAAEDLLARYDDQDFSYVDATSFVAMRRLGLEEVLAFDHHFSTVGFVLLRRDR